MRFFFVLLVMTLFPLNSFANVEQIEELTRAIEQSSPENKYKFLQYRAKAYLKADKFQKAVNDLNVSLSLFPTAPAYRMRGEANLKLNKYQNAVNDLSMAISSNPNDITSYKLRSQAYFANDDYKQALDDSEKVLAVRPADEACKYIKMESEVALNPTPDKIVISATSRPRRSQARRVAAAGRVARRAPARTIVKRKVVRKS